MCNKATTRWKLDIVRIPVFGDYTNVVRRVDWTCIAEDGGAVFEKYGSIKLPMPTNPESYIDIVTIRAMDDTLKRATVLGWAEIISPGFVAATEARALACLAARMAQPVSQTETLL